MGTRSGGLRVMKRLKRPTVEGARLELRINVLAVLQ